VLDAGALEVEDIPGVEWLNALIDERIVRAPSSALSSLAPKIGVRLRDSTGDPGSRLPLQGLYTLHLAGE
jgi:hypothetical protein